MNPARAADDAYIHFLIGSPRVVSTTEAARMQLLAETRTPIPANWQFRTADARNNLKSLYPQLFV